MKKLLGSYRPVSYDSLKSDGKTVKKDSQAVFTEEGIKYDVNPEDEASFLGRITFWWALPLMRHVGKTRRFTKEEVPPVRKCEESSVNTSRLEQYWAEKKGKGLIWCLILFVYPQLLVVIPFFFVMQLLPIGQAYIAGTIARYLTHPGSVNPYEGYGAAVGMIVVTLMSAVLNPIFRHQSFRIGMKIRVALAGQIYKKIMELDNFSIQKFGTGNIMTKLSTDLETIIEQQLMIWLFRMPTLPIIIPLLTWLVYSEMGLIGISGIIVTLVVSFLLALLQPLMSKLRGMVAIKTGERIKLMDSIIRSIRIVKLYCWEEHFGKAISTARNKEMKALALSLLVQLFLSTYYAVGKFLPQVVSIIIFVMHGGILTPSNSVRVIGYLGTVGLSVVAIGTVFPFSGHAYKSVKRIEEFLNAAPDENDTLEVAEEGIDIDCSHLCAKWKYGLSPDVCDTVSKAKDTIFRLDDITFRVNKGSLLIVTGDTGSGKTSLLMAILNNLHITGGKLLMNSSVSYVPQEPWLFAGTIRENILLGEEIDKEWYNKVIHSCGLESDFKTLQYGDLSIVGEKGMNLSGGQKARINLAMAVYQWKDIILLDDPLSSVDTKVGKFLFKECIQGLLAMKTRVLVTHHLQYLPYADSILILNNGKVAYFGAYDNMGKDLKEKYKIDQTPVVPSVAEGSKKSSIEQEEEDKTLLKEHSERGVVSWRVYKELFDKGRGPIFLIPCLLLGMAAEGVLRYWKKFLSEWEKDYEKLVGNSSISHNHGCLYTAHDINIHGMECDRMRWRIGVYTALSIVYLACDVLAQAFLLLFIITAAKRIHNRMLCYVIGAKISFFATPVGIILNRFSRDLCLVDTQMFFLIIKITKSAFWLLATIGFTFVTLPWLGLCLVPLGVSGLWINMFGIKSVREFKRMEAVCRSPLFSHASNTLEGHITIKSLKKSAHFIRMFHIHQNCHTSAYNIYLCTYRWIALWNGVIAVAYLTAALVVAYIIGATGSSGTLLGIVILLIAQSISYVQNIAAFFVELDMMMTCVERVLEYGNLSQEEDVTGDIRIDPPLGWPEQGVIEYQNVYLQYENTDTWALQNVNFTIQKSEKIGIIGKTGAGKTSLFKVLTRLVEFEGTIFIDGIGISFIPLKKLRQSISVIPQDPILLDGSIKSNLDPFDEKTDDDIWRALYQVQLAEFVKGLPAQLGTELGEGLGDISVGQKQLLCLARALLKRNKILIIDEATANVDYRTDEQIQLTLQQQFHDCTVLTIAHRINTVLDYDKIMAISDGRVVEFDTPAVLLSQPDSILNSMLSNGRS